jgi:PAS domain S-box-containing protein
MTQDNGGNEKQAQEQVATPVQQQHRIEERLRLMTGDDSALHPDDESPSLQEVTEKLRISEDRFHNLFNSSATGIAISTPQGRFLLANAAYCRMLGYTESELLCLDFPAITHPDDLHLNLDMRNDLLAGLRDSFVMEKRYLRKNGDIQWSRTSVSAVHATNGEILTLLVVAEDISERKIAQAQLGRVNRLHAVLSKIAEATVRTESRHELYDTVCRVVVDVGLLRMAFIAELDGQSGLATPVASHGAKLDDLLDKTNWISLDGGAASPSTVGTALRTGRYVVCNDILAAEHMAPWRGAAAKNGLLSNASFPFRLHGAVVGVLVLYASERDYFFDDEIALMVTVANTVSFALEAHEKEQARRRAEAASALLAAIVESSDDAIMGSDLEGTITSWNKGAESIYGYSRSEMVGASIMRVVPENLRDEEDRLLQRIRTGDSLDSFETMRRTKSGSLVNVSITASPIRSADGEIAGVSRVVRDITKAKKSEARVRRLIDSNVQGVFFWNTQGEVVSANDYFLDLLQYSRADLHAGRVSWTAVTPPEYAEADRRALDELAATGVCAPLEKEFTRKDGSRVPVLVGAALFEDNSKEGVCFVLDLTARKRLEQQIRQTQKLESVGALATGVAHDFNNILAVIQMQADLLKDGGGLSADQREAADDISAAVGRAAALTRQLLLFSSREVFQPKDMDLSESIADMLKMLRRIVGEHIEMELKLAAHPMRVHADRGMMDQVLMNLVVNARDAMPSGGRLVIETNDVELDGSGYSRSSPERAGSFVCLSVSDTGCGIPAENLTRIFEPFFTTKDVGKGTGLGLATVFGILRQHHGWADVTSELGIGTTFRIYLPRLGGLAGPKASTQAQAATPRGSETILLVEDDADLQLSVQTILSRLGYRILGAPNGAAALDVWRENQHMIKLMITDLVMPGGMTGMELAKHVRKENPNLKVICMTGYSAELAARNAPLCDGLICISKPFQALQLASAVRNCLDEP